MDDAGFRETWEALPSPYRLAIELAWESCRAGSLGVGAVVTDADGVVVASGRNRLVERHPGEDLLAGTPVAHAEMNALGKLAFGVDHVGHTLWTTLEPCVLCAAGARLATIGHVRFLAPDPVMVGASRLPEVDPWCARRWPDREGPHPSPLAAFGLLLPLHAMTFWSPDRRVEDAWRHDAPRLTALAAELVTSLELVVLATEGALVDEVLAVLWDRLAACAPELLSTGSGEGEPRLSPG